MCCSVTAGLLIINYTHGELDIDVELQVTHLRMAGTTAVHTEPILQNPAETINRLKFQQRISSARDRAASSLCIKRCSGQISLFLEELGFHFMCP